MKRMRQWLGIMMAVILAAGTVQAPVCAVETGTTAAEAEAEAEDIEGVGIAEDEEAEIDLTDETSAAEEDPADDATQEEPVPDDIDAEEDTLYQPSESAPEISYEEPEVSTEAASEEAEDQDVHYTDVIASQEADAEVVQENELTSDQIRAFQDKVKIWKYENQITIVYDSTEDIMLSYSLYSEREDELLYEGNLKWDEESGLYYEAVDFDVINEKGQAEDDDFEVINIRDIPVKIVLDDGSSQYDEYVTYDLSGVVIENVDTDTVDEISIEWNPVERADGYSVIVRGADEDGTISLYETVDNWFDMATSNADIDSVSVVPFRFDEASGVNYYGEAVSYSVHDSEAEQENGNSAQEEPADEEKDIAEEVVPEEKVTESKNATAVYYGQCGDNVAWTLFNDGTLYVDGTGELIMNNKSYDTGATFFDWKSSDGHICSDEIKKAIIGEGITAIASFAFQDCHNLVSVSMADTVTEIRWSVFSGCENLNTVNFPNALKIIYNYAFQGCKSLKSISLPESVKEIRTGAFKGSGLTSLRLPKDMDLVGEDICVNAPLEELFITGDIKTWYWHTFDYCTSLKTVILADGLTNIGGYCAFSQCTALVEIEIPKTVEMIENEAFSHCTSLQKVVFRGDAPDFARNQNSSSIFHFFNDTLTAYYPAENSTWTSDKLQNYGGTITWKPYYSDVSKCTVTLSNTSIVYNGQAQTPVVNIENGGMEMKAGTDYTVSYSNNINAGTATVTVTGIGKYTGTVNKTFTITKAAPTLSFASTSVSKKTTDSAFTNTLTKKTDGTVTFKSSNTAVATVNSSSGQVTIKGAGTATITANAAAGTNYKAGSASYTLTVTEAGTGSETINDYSYSFANIRSSFGYPSGYRIPLSVYQTLFGSNSKAEMYYKSQSGWGGNCLGFASTSALMNTASSGVTAKAFNPGAAGIPDLGVSDRSNALAMNVTTFIELLQISQKTVLFSKARKENRAYSLELSGGKKNLDGLYQTVKDQTSSGKAVVIAAAQNGSGHALLAFGIEDTSSTSARIHIYDSNHPLDGNRYMTLTKSSGHWTGWSCDLGGNLGTWSSGNDSSNISYIPVSVVEEIWSTRGNLDENRNVLSFNTGRLEVYNSNDQKIATVEDGELTTSDDEIVLLEDDLQDGTDATFEECGVSPGEGKGGQKAAASGDLQMIALPVGVYTFKNADGNTPSFRIMMADTNLSAEVVTTADEILMSVDDSCNLNAVQVEAGESDTYSITLNSTNVDNEIHEVSVSGTGRDGQLMVSQSGDSLNFSNCNIGSLTINGEDQGPYAISASAGTGGKISPAGETLLLKGNSQKYTITPDSGYEIQDVKVDGKSVGAKSTYTFSSISGAHTISATFRKKTAQKFSDVPSTYAFYQQIEWASDNGIVSGYSDGTFRPQGECKRKQVVAFLWRMKGSPAPKSTSARFSDVSTKTDFYKAIYWASENNIVLGFSDGTFRPDDTCTRGQVVAFLWRIAGRPAPKGSSSKFSDVTKTHSFYKAILWASENGIVQGYSDGTFRPDNTCTRGQIVAFIYRYANLK